MTARAEHADVLIIGAGISGIGVASHLTAKHPERTLKILEARGAVGGTWDLFRYPGVRSDSDLQTFGFTFRPWPGKRAIATGEEIRNYLVETADETGIAKHIEFDRRVVSADWSSEDALWRVVAEDANGGKHEFTANWIFCASGYYRYDRGYQAELPGIENFQGSVEHPQFWDESLDTAGKEVVIVGSGATAITMAPAMAGEGAHVTLLQRSPSYIISLPAKDAVANLLRRVFGEKRGHALGRRKNIRLTNTIYKLSQRFPRQVAWAIRQATKRQLPKGYDVNRHFRPYYGPWDQRMCVVPDGDLFKAISSGGVEVVTDRIRTFTEDSVQLESGRKIKADVVVTATGLELLLLGGIEGTVDGEKINAPDHFAYKGMMISGVPNMAFAIGYVNASWTLKVELVAEHFCEILSLLDQRGASVAVPEPPPAGSDSEPLLDLQAGYIQRSLDELPRQGSSAPWRQSMDYYEDLELLRDGSVGDHMVLRG